MKEFFGGFLAAFLALPAWANDSTAVQEAGGLRLVRDAPVEMLQEDLTISPTQVDVSYLFRSAYDMDVKTLVAFPLPEYDLAWHGYSVLGGPGDTVRSRGDFKIWVDDRRIVPQLEVRTLRNGIDVTQVLRDAGIPPETLDFDFLTSHIASLPADVQQRLVQADLVEAYGGGEYQPEWTIKATYFWMQEFPAEKIVSIRHSYEPIAGQFFISHPELKDVDTENFCMSSAEKQGVLNRLDKSQYDILIGTEVHYVLSTGANWHGPIQSFNLTIDKADPAAMVSLCFDGLKKVAPTRFEARLRDFTPERDLQILFVSAPE